MLSNIPLSRKRIRTRTWILGLAVPMSLQAYMPIPVVPGAPPFEDYSTHDTLSSRRTTRTTETIDYRTCESTPAQLEVRFEWRAANEPFRPYRMTRNLCLQRDTSVDTSSYLDVMDFDPRSMFPTSIYSGYPTTPIGSGRTEERAFNPFGNGFDLEITVKRYRRAPSQVAIRGHLPPKGLERFEFDTTVVADSHRVVRFPKPTGTLTIAVRRNLPQRNVSQSANTAGENDTLAIRRFISANVTKSYDTCPKDSADVEIDLAYAIASRSLSFHKTFYKRFVRKAFLDTEAEFDLAPASFNDSIRTLPLFPTKHPASFVSSERRDSGQWGRIASAGVATPLMGDSVGFWLMVYGMLHADSAEIDWEERLGVANDTNLHWEKSGMRVDANIRFLRDPKRSRPHGPPAWLVWVGLGGAGVLGLLVALRRKRS